MVFVVLAVGAAVYFTAKKVQDRKEKKKAAKAQVARQHGAAQMVSNTGDNAVPRPMETLPPYQNDSLPPYLAEKVPPYQQQHLSPSPA
jgi:hypothetical protein